MIDEKKYVKIISDTVKQASEPAQSEVLNQDITVTENGVYKADAGYTGLGTVTVNVQPKLVMQFRKSDTNVLLKPIDVIDLSGIEDVGLYVLSHKYYNNQDITGYISGLKSLIKIAGSHACEYMFYESNFITGADLSGIRTISGSSACYRMFQGCVNFASVDVSNIEYLTGDSCLQYAFAGTKIESLSFPRLTSQSFGSYTNQFNNMLYNVNGCTVHFPSNLQAVIGSWTAVQNGFGGTNTTVLFDLPATE